MQVMQSTGPSKKLAVLGIMYAYGETGDPFVTKVLDAAQKLVADGESCA
jgi:hypothetical protein